MSTDNKNIDEILNDFREKKESLESSELLPPAPPISGEDLTEPPQAEDEQPKKKKPKKEKKPVDSQKIKKLLRKAIIIVTVSALIVALVFGIKFAVGYAKVAYLKPYQEKYPDVEFPVGIMEEYCDAYGQNPGIKGSITISDSGQNSKLLTSEDVAPITDNAERFNYTVYLETNELEKHYKNAQAYNSSAKGMEYSNLFDEFSFQVIGAFYTNTDPADDLGYTFPYSVAEKMTEKSYHHYFDRLSTRLLYTVEGTQAPTAEDTMLTISCPTDYRDGYRFIIVAKQVEKIDQSLKATDKEKIHITDAEYKEQGKENPYRFASKWYPEIIVTDEHGNQTTIKKTADDYKN